jgi:hypothetical protein
MSYDRKEDRDQNDDQPLFEEVFPKPDISPAPLEVVAPRASAAQKKAALNAVVEALKDLDVDAQCAVIRSAIHLLDLREDIV